MAANFKIEESQFLRDLRGTAINKADKVVSKVWKRAYLRLADAANCLDAMEARTIDKKTNNEQD